MRTSEVKTVHLISSFLQEEDIAKLEICVQRFQLRCLYLFRVCLDVQFGSDYMTFSKQNKQTVILLVFKALIIIKSDAWVFEKSDYLITVINK